MATQLVMGCQDTVMAASLSQPDSSDSQKHYRLQFLCSLIKVIYITLMIGVEAKGLGTLYRKENHAGSENTPDIN
eukprot:1154268-Pelagomonas_calceolata.AAC.1